MQRNPNARGGDADEVEDTVAEVREYWDALAAEFDVEPDHGLRNATVRTAWNALLKELMPPPCTRVVDMGCGTGSLSVLLAAQGHSVTGIDLSPAMLAIARKKAARLDLRIEFVEGDAARPLNASQPFDVLVARHLLWSFPDPAAILCRWRSLLKADGCMILVEGNWSTGGGLRKLDMLDFLPASMSIITERSLSDESAYWGGPVDDERYVVVASGCAHG